MFNTAIDHVRRHAKYKEVMDFEVERDGAVNNLSLDYLQVEDLYRLIQQLPTSSRTVFNLYVIEGYQHKEIAEILGITVGTSKWHLANARKELQAMLHKLQQHELNLMLRSV